MTDKCFFRLDDDSVCYLIVALSLEHAKQLMRESNLVFGRAETGLDGAPNLVWTELEAEQAAQKARCYTEDDRGVIKLIDANIGDWFSSEW